MGTLLGLAATLDQEDEEEFHSGNTPGSLVGST